MATGNPRNKVALKPGFSLVGWIRLTNSGEDLTGGRKGSVSLEELKRHDQVDDCWMAIRGKVYNVTRYMEYHPGGSEQLIRGAGKDATNLFDEYHAWVNIEQLLAKCYIGPLKHAITLNLSDLDEKPKNSRKSSLTLSPPTTMIGSLSPINETEKSDTSAIQVPLAQTYPRFDWIQRKNDLTVYFYCKSFSNPGIIIEQICDKEFKVTIFIGNDVYIFQFSFFKNLKWPASIKVNQETGKVEISFEKEEADLWPSYGMHEKITGGGYSYCEFIIIEKEPINHDSFELILRPKSDKIIYFISLGHHVDLKLSVEGQNVMRSYTPIPARYVSLRNSLPQLNFLIKKYYKRKMSNLLYERSSNESILVSSQCGYFQLNSLKSHVNIAFISAGSGITPFCGLIDHLLERFANKVENVVLYDYNKTKEDIWFYDLFNEMTEKDKRFKVNYVLSEPNESWTGETGKISEKILDELQKLDVTVAMICGPLPFTAEALKILSASSKKIEAISFQG
ncbi:cytochrome b5 reductase 4 [Chironomus tepperi]|uniref:cytochrome b5 reductase 4 n=1 Tax=Chironomus tepperi TaxID=113505 RepID=UPI00391F2C14